MAARKKRDHKKVHARRKALARQRAEAAREIGLDVVPEATPAQLRRILDRAEAAAPGTKERFGRALEAKYGRRLRIGAPVNKGRKTETTPIGGGGRHIDSTNKMALLNRLKKANPKEKVLIRVTFEYPEGEYRTKDLTAAQLSNSAINPTSLGGPDFVDFNQTPEGSVEMTFGPQARDGIAVRDILDLVDLFDDLWAALFALWLASISPGGPA